MVHGADVARRIRTSVMQHARPRGRAARDHAVQGGADAWQGPHESTRMPVRGTTWREKGLHLEGPRISGPW